jgi:hypothetical protein
MGSTDTAVIRYTAAMITDAANLFTVVESAANGTIITIVRPGLYAIDMYAALAGAGALQIGISLNAAAAGALTGTPADFVAVDAGAGTEGIIACTGDTLATTVGDYYCGVVRRFAQGDVIRFMATAGVTLDADNSRVFAELVLPG